MGNEAGEWIIHGVTWDDPKCIHDVDEAVEYINRVGFLPLFKNEIPGFSLEERTVAEYWWSDDPVRDPWRWRIAIAKKHDVLYGKFFAKKAGFISKKWLPYHILHEAFPEPFPAPCRSEACLSSRPRRRHRTHKTSGHPC